MKIITLNKLFIIAALLLSGCASEHDKLVSMGKEIYTANCKVCHAQGINGAPVLGNKAN